MTRNCLHVTGFSMSILFYSYHFRSDNLFNAYFFVTHIREITFCNRNFHE